jgi:hypothetical protein
VVGNKKVDAAFIVGAIGRQADVAGKGKGIFTATIFKGFQPSYADFSNRRHLARIQRTLRYEVNLL